MIDDKDCGPESLACSVDAHRGTIGGIDVYGLH